MLIKSVPADEYYVFLDIKLLINRAATGDYNVVLDINVLTNSLTVDE